MLLKALRAFGDHVRSIPGSAPGRRARRRWLASGRVARAAGTPGRAVPGRLLGGPDPGGRTRPARLRDHRGRARPAVRPPFRAGPAHRPGARAPRRGADRRPGRAADQPHRADPDGGRHAHRAVPHLQGHRHARLRQHRAGRRAGAGLGRPHEAAHFGRRTFPRSTSPTGRSGRCRSWWRSCSTRRPTTSRWSGGCGTAGRTTPRSATWQPAGSSTATSCTTSTSRALTSASRARRSPRGRRRASRWSPRSATPACRTG